MVLCFRVWRAFAAILLALGISSVGSLLAQTPEPSRVPGNRLPGLESLPPVDRLPDAPIISASPPPTHLPPIDSSGVPQQKAILPSLSSAPPSVMGKQDAASPSIPSLPKSTTASKDEKKDCKEEKKDSKDDKKDSKNDKKDETPKEWWQKVPVVQVFPRPGNFVIFRTDPGYFSAADCLHGEYRDKAPKYPYPRFSVFMNSFFDMDWRYLDDPKNTEYGCYDSLKRQRFGSEGQFLFTTGGEIRARYNWEQNSRALNEGPIGLRGDNNSYDLFRVRAYGDLFWYDQIRVFAEVIGAYSPNYDLPPLIIDRDIADLLNAFVEVNLGEIKEQPVWLRIGRQELLFGSQRLISPLDWANTRRTFQGLRLFRHSEKHDVDVFLVQPIVPDWNSFDSVDNNVVFAGLWYTHRPKPGTFIDGYYLLLDNTNPVNRGRGNVRGGTTVNTVGGRYAGDKDNWLWDLEGMVQFGTYSNQALLANAFTAGVGYHFKDCRWTPQIWLFYDHASGDPTPGEGNTRRTFNQLFPFGHYYFGFVDVVGRRNINDINAHLIFQPEQWLTCLLQVHNFYLDSPKDALYNAAGLPIRQDRSGRAGIDVGHELDFLVNLHLARNQDVLFSYSYLFAGNFLKATATTPNAARDLQALYLQYTYRW
jgi:hypothetical protein